MSPEPAGWAGFFRSRGCSRMAALALALVIVGAVLAVVHLVQTKFSDLTAWGLLAVATGVGLLLG